MLMKRIVDLHIHSKFSAATSDKMDLSHLAKYGDQKGLDLIGTGDFTHPEWFNILTNELEKKANGLYEHQGMYFIPTVEVHTLYNQDGHTRKIHHLVIAPDLSIVSQINEALNEYGKLDEDGRPTLSLSSPELVEIVYQISRECEIIPAHIWTPWYSLFGSRSGFDSLKNCYQDMSSHIHAIETGLSSDPPMNWRLPELDELTLVSFSDAHSPWPFRIGREATVLDLEELGYKSILSAIKENENVSHTIEFFPEEGKYHLDGHRKCGIRLKPKEAEKLNNICPKCRKKLTLGVSHRVEELASRAKGFKPENTPSFIHTIPLQEIIGKALGIKTLYSKKIWQVFNKLVKKFGSEYTVVFNTPREELEEIVSTHIVDAILRVRKEQVTILPGFDSQYGEIAIFNEEKARIKEKKDTTSDQTSLSDFL